MRVEQSYRPCGENVWQGEDDGKFYFQPADGNWSEAFDTFEAARDFGQPKEPYDDMLLQCVKCEKLTTVREARLRTFNTDRCGFCNGDLEQPAWDMHPTPSPSPEAPVEPVDDGTDHS